ncbi:redox-sensitive bicupin YhaK (pirin superfamily) [Herbaspirillum rubrisubalbicans]|nr:redox-sensitive bicupin YhaK (pirin superfamily) [Herbaspirillum rubrisubalbicans]
MSNILHKIQGLTRDIGFPVRRLLPAAAARTVGPFVFFDHMGPVEFDAGTTEGDVRPHPHIGLATVTYLFSGAMMHRDSLGVVQRITPGAVNWMAAGRGIVHSERIPDDIREQKVPVHGLQMWVALPAEQEEGDPLFRHYAAQEMPETTVGGARLHVLAGSAFGVSSPVITASPTLYVAGSTTEGAELEIAAEVQERALYVVRGDVTLDGERLEAGTLAHPATGGERGVQGRGRISVHDPGRCAAGWSALRVVEFRRHLARQDRVRQRGLEQPQQAGLPRHPGRDRVDSTAGPLTLNG